MNKTNLLFAVAAVIVIAAVFYIFYYALTENADDKFIPEITTLYEGNSYSGSLQNYRWNGQSPLPNTDFDLPANWINLTKGASVEFFSNDTRQPDYYLVTLIDISSSGSDAEEIVLQDERLDRNGIILDFAENKRYLLYTTGIWVIFGFSGQSHDSVTYAFLIDISPQDD